MKVSTDRFWYWPSAAQLRYALWLGCLQASWFGLLYGGADWLTRQHNYRVPLHLSIDLAIPLVPWTAIVYVSMMPLLWLAPFILRTRGELEGMVLSQAAATLLAVPFFLFLPAAPIHWQPDDALPGIFMSTLEFARWMALRHNFFPSLHVTFTVICISIYGLRASSFQKLFLWCWGAGIVASTLLTHQHYLVDVVGGLVLGRVMVSVVNRPWTSAGSVPKPATSLPTQRSCPEPQA